MLHDMQKTCGQCSAAFDISPHDRSLLEKVSPVFGEKQEPIPPPTLCPLCRLQRRLLFRNERKFYRRTCDLTGKDIISIYAPDKPCVVYDQSAWWSDAWDQYATGRSFDFQKSFFEQFHALSLVAPRPCVVNMFSENSTYTNHCAYNKNCYMCINTGYSEDCFYCTNYNLYNRDCADCLAIQHCE